MTELLREQKEKLSTTIFDNMYSNNPFSQPPDEKIFTFKQEEKERRAETREMLKRQNIAEKSRPIRAGRLRQLFENNEEDISNVSSEFNNYKRSKSQEAASAVLAQRKPVKMECRRKIIDKKREMFFLQMMVELKQTEIQKIRRICYLERRRAQIFGKTDGSATGKI